VVPRHTPANPHAHARARTPHQVDISEQCGYSLAQQAALFHSIKPLFANKPLLIVVNKTDVRPLADLCPQEEALLQEMEAEAARISSGGSGAAAAGGAAGGSSSCGERHLMTMSTLTEEGVMAVKHAACDRLLAHRVEVKLAGRRIGDVLNRMHVALPKAPAAAAAARPPVIPPSVLAARAAAAAAAVAGQGQVGEQQQQAASRRKTEKDLQEEHGGAGALL
jgi:nucleolar GTP-binding protein